MRYTRFISWAQGLYVAGLVLGLLFIVPSPWFPLQIGKATVAALCMLLATVFFVLGGGARTLLREKNPLLVLLAALLPISYGVSYFSSVDRTVALVGYSLEADTIMFVVLAFCTFVLSLGLFRSLWSSRILLVGVAAAAAIAGVFQFLVIFFGGTLLPSVFTDHSVNLIGKWNDLGLFVGLLLLFVLMAFEYGAASMGRKVLLGAVAVVSVILLAIIHFPLVWTLLLVASIAMALWSLVLKRPSGNTDILHMVPWVPVCGIAVSGVLLLWGTVVNTGLTTVLPVSSLEIRPSMSSSLGVVKAAHGDSVSMFLFGTGPQTFGQVWLVHKPSSVNASVFWNLDFNVAYSNIITALATVGLFGVLAWLVPLALVLIALVTALRSSHFSPKEKLYSAYLASGAIYLWAGMLFYVPSEMLVLLGFALAGATLGFAFSKRQAEGEVLHAPSQMVMTGMIAVSLVLVVVLGWATMGFTKRTVAESHTNQGILELQQGRVDTALVLAAKAQEVEKTNNNLRLSIDAGLVRLQQLAQTGGTPTSQQLQDFATQAQQTIPQGQLAIQLNPKDYRTYVSLGRVYDFLNSLGVSGAYDNAKQMYQIAATLNPTNPQIPLLTARLEAAKGNLPGVQAALQQSLTLKPDYTDAILFVVQLNVAQKDIPNAIRAATAAVQSAPGVPSIWFELGLLYYSAGDTASAVSALEEAVKRQGDYANAKYFLGLSYAAQNRMQDATQQFIDLAKTNPDNQEVKLILTNLQAGRLPFTNAQPPVTNKPQDRTTAPISQ